MNADTVDLTRRRRITVRMLAVLGLVTFSFMLMFVVSDAKGRVGQVHQLEPAGSPEAQIGADHPGETVHIAGAAAALALGGTGLIGLIARPQRAGSATQAGAASIAMLITIGIVGDPDNYGGQGLLFDPAFLILALPPLAAASAAAPWRAWRHGRVPRPRLLAVALLALPAVWYGIDQGVMQRNTWPPLADPHHQAHWYAMSVLPSQPSWSSQAPHCRAAVGGSRPPAQLLPHRPQQSPRCSIQHQPRPCRPCGPSSPSPGAPRSWRSPGGNIGTPVRPVRREASRSVRTDPRGRTP